jgi:RNAse (barnase) inhibitor barstar
VRLSRFIFSSDSHRSDSASLEGRQTSNALQQLIDEVKAEFEAKLKSLIPRVEARQTSNAAQQLIDEIKAEFEAKLKSLIPREECAFLSSTHLRPR